MRKLLLSLALCLSGCKTIVLDTSMTAVEAGDYTLVFSLCEAGLGVGIDICRVTEGDVISSTWNLVVPTGHMGGEIDVYFKDLHRTYAVNDTVVVIPWRDFFRQDRWSLDLDGEAMALAIVRWKDKTGIVKEVKYRGIAKIVVTKPGYERMPIDSGQHQWGTTCKVQYSTSGRSAVQCR